ncbi:MAG TPA: hypothetical protein DF613_15155 [Lachnospiraceae bacterium]|nr:hypothetical protein [Lachnospiraceae bacterium]
MDILQTMKKRHSARQYSDRKIEGGEVRKYKQGRESRENRENRFPCFHFVLQLGVFHKKGLDIFCKRVYNYIKANAFTKKMWEFPTKSRRI